ncbi:MAG: T9SS type A sorting domain-containing protein [Ignavibacterium sp.]|jgi:hypothetical protein|nr:T9SS type A sorting domain-containing protein [Ignavibacterium sp.]
MKKYLISIIIVFVLSVSLFPQDITFVPRETELTDTLNSEMVFEIDATNISAAEQILFIVRTLNSLPEDWSSSICLDSCLPGWVDSATTSSEYGSSPFQPGETRVVALHVFPKTNVGAGYVQMQAGTLRNPEIRIAVDLTAIVNPVSAEEEKAVVDNYYIAQNYPNPFNPSTRINFGLKNAGNVEITVYNILGNKITTLVNEFKSAGNHSVSFNASNLSSGIYFYKIITNEFVQTKKMILEK